jgi:hypothetical protein
MYEDDVTTVCWFGDASENSAPMRGIIATWQAGGN